MDDVQFTQLVKQYTPLILTVCYRLTGDYQEAENLTQETFLTAYRAIDRFEGDRYQPWLVRIAANKAKDFLKSAYHRTTAPTAEETLDALPQQQLLHETVEARDATARIRAACESLPDPYREVALLHFLEDRSFEEIAAVLGRPLKTVQTQGYRARDKLRKTLREEGSSCRIGHTT